MKTQVSTFDGRLVVQSTNNNTTKFEIEECGEPIAFLEGTLFDKFLFVENYGIVKETKIKGYFSGLIHALLINLGYKICIRVEDAKYPFNELDYTINLGDWYLLNMHGAYLRHTNHPDAWKLPPIDLFKNNLVENYIGRFPGWENYHI